MNGSLIDATAEKIWQKVFSAPPDAMQRCGIGWGNYVYIGESAGEKRVIRFNEDKNAYAGAVYWLPRLREARLPVPCVLDAGRLDSWSYLVLTYIEGQDIGVVYPQLNSEEKQRIAKDVVEIQSKAGQMRVESLPEGWSWRSFAVQMLARAKRRIAANGYFDVEKVDRLETAMGAMEDYFSKMKPTLYFDDVSTKNLLIQNGSVSGIIDIDSMGMGDALTYVALTYIALLNMEYDTDYVKYILDAMSLKNDQRKAFLFYSLLYCADFMGERGTRFQDKTVEVNERIIERLNSIYETLWSQWLDWRETDVGGL